MDAIEGVNVRPPSLVDTLQSIGPPNLGGQKDIAANSQSATHPYCNSDDDKSKESFANTSNSGPRESDGVTASEFPVEGCSNLPGNFPLLESQIEFEEHQGSLRAKLISANVVADSKDDYQPLDLKDDLEDIQASKILRFDEIYDLLEHRTRLRKTIIPPLAKKRQTSAALAVRRVTNFVGDYEWTKVDIKSEALYQVLLEINKDVKDLEIRMKPPIADPELFFYSLHNLTDRIKTENLKVPRNKALIADLKAAISFSEEYHKDTITTVQSLSKTKEISWGLLWTIFCPNTLVYSRNINVDTDQVLKLIHCKRGICIPHERPQNEHKFWVLTCQYFGITARDGTTPGSHQVAGYCTVDVKINEYPGVMEVTDLVVYPLQYKENRTELEKALVGRGKKYTSLKGIEYLQYQRPKVKAASSDGKSNSTLRIREDDLDHNTEISEDEVYTENIMIDSAGFRLYLPDSKLLPQIDKKVRASAITYEDYLICWPMVLGFSFRSKVWHAFDISRLAPVDFNDDAFESLVIDPGRKKIIRSLINQHSRTLGYDDIIEGKGQGLIGLFAGGSGCGKTLTVEAVAQETKKPLYMVSAGELGSEPSTVDRRLSRVLDLSYRWDAILLLDEADVFLQRRSNQGDFRNPMVSIFLRQLEYFKGIMILTTNRVDDCDPAFESRIHFSMFYPELGYEARKLIWKTFLRKATVTGKCENVQKRNMSGVPGVPSLPETSSAAQSQSLLVDEFLLNMLAKYPLNGRQIQNVIRTANTLAQEEVGELKKSHLEAVLAVGTAWNASRSRVEAPRDADETIRAKYPYRKSLTSFIIICWKNWVAGVPGSFPDEMFTLS